MAKETPAPATPPAPVTPPVVRIGISLLFGIAVASQASPLPKMWIVITLLVSIAAALLLLIAHPYRKELQQAFATQQKNQAPSIRPILPVLPLWVAMMVAQALRPVPWLIVGVILLVAAGYTWLFVPHMDRTRELD